MKKGYHHDTFSFSTHFDRQFLDALYEGDLQSAEEVFHSAVVQIAQELDDAEVLFSNNDITGVRKIFHRIKPLFGYVGLLHIQEQVNAFEEQCIQAPDAELLLDAFKNIKTVVRDASSKIAAEKNRLSDYNKKRA